MHASAAACLAAPICSWPPHFRRAASMKGWKALGRMRGWMRVRWLAGAGRGSLLGWVPASFARRSKTAWQHRVVHAAAAEEQALRLLGSDVLPPVLQPGSSAAADAAG